MHLLIALGVGQPKLRLITRQFVKLLVQRNGAPAHQDVVGAIAHNRSDPGWKFLRIAHVPACFPCCNVSVIPRLALEMAAKMIV